MAILPGFLDAGDAIAFELFAPSAGRVVGFFQLPALPFEAFEAACKVRPKNRVLLCNLGQIIRETVPNNGRENRPVARR
jgi:hypothetical protein